ncbi:hypothetical protein JCGZ_09519 [Jatropha curcas]|uniref:Uncharacterized protein n=1 Tax=Jatropha curcas TaxID=180498 RepID=A0A067KWU2_JATCU|nr:hypothetical protein JCGZ_09519 [Jatropha curcas]
MRASDSLRRFAGTGVLGSTAGACAALTCRGKLDLPGTGVLEGMAWACAALTCEAIFSILVARACLVARFGHASLRPSRIFLLLCGTGVPEGTARACYPLTFKSDFHLREPRLCY